MRIAILDKRSFYFYAMHLYWKHMLEAKVIFFTDNESYNWFEQFLKTWVFYHSLWLVQETPPPKKHLTLKPPQTHQQQLKMWRRERRQKE